MNQEINTLKEAFDHQELDLNNLPDISGFPEKFQKPLMAFFKLMVLNAAVHDNKPKDWNDINQWKYEPWFKLSSSGSGFSYLDYGYDGTHSGVGSRLTYLRKEHMKELLENEEILEVYKDFMIE